MFINRTVTLSTQLANYLLAEQNVSVWVTVGCDETFAVPIKLDTLIEHGSM
jgi:hypothetical protein